MQFKKIVWKPNAEIFIYLVKHIDAKEENKQIIKNVPSDFKEILDEYTDVFKEVSTIPPK